MVAIAAATIAVVLFMVVADMGPDVMLVAALCVLIGVGVWFISDLMNASVEPLDVVSRRAPAITPTTDRRVLRLRSDLAYGQNERSWERLRASLVDIVDDQLRVAHRIDRVECPDAARAVLGDELFAFVDDPTAGSALAQRHQLDRIVTLIEQI